MGVESDIKRLKELKHEFPSDNDQGGLEEYFERDKSEVESDPKNSQGTHCEYIAARKDVNIEELYLEASQHVADLQVEVSELEKLWTAIR